MQVEITSTVPPAKGIITALQMQQGEFGRVLILVNKEMCQLAFGFKGIINVGLH